MTRAKGYLLISLIRTVIVMLSVGRMIGRKLKLCGQIGVRQTTCAEGWTIDPPQLRLYAVLPVGVAISSPSPVTVVS